ncbi:20S proteasome subunit alpha 4 [Nematocida sp. LUAm3]|nr:20S proteasome subunit alpha 4 [Nematocida sp. LUAm3]KAI5174011.1 20S proteasome subunit alpha 4 [Nematocida sp. LUAm2]KAI5177245.1 20S proteasome subunit alpha 4 [Nematocida sp. LUAm1]
MAKYDRALSIFSPDGRIFQVEYAQLASERGSPVIFFSDKKSISVAIEKRADTKNRVLSDLYKFREVETDIYMSFAGMYPDCLVIIDKAILLSKQFSLTTGEKIDIKKLSLELADYMQQYTITGGRRPFGAKVVLFGFDKEHIPQISIVEPDGNYAYYVGGAMGQKSEKAVEELEKHDNVSLTPSQIVTKALYAVAQKDPLKMTVLEITPNMATILTPNCVTEIVTQISPLVK